MEHPGGIVIAGKQDLSPFIDVHAIIQSQVGSRPLIGQKQLLLAVFRWTYPAGKPVYTHTAQAEAVCLATNLVAFEPHVPAKVVPVNDHAALASLAIVALYVDALPGTPRGKQSK